MRSLTLVPLTAALMFVAACSDSPTAPSPVDAALATVRTATSPFQRVEDAVAAGYAAPLAANCVQSPAGAMGVHSANPLLVQAPVQVERPPILLYLPDARALGGFRLVGVEYLQAALVRNTATGAVAPWFSPDPWPSSHVLVNEAPELFGQRFAGPMAGHEPGRPWHYDLHVWVWTENPSGTFAEFNPRLSCPR